METGTGESGRQERTSQGHEAVVYRDGVCFASNDLKDLFLSVDWDSGNHPEKLLRAMENSHAVVTAWQGGELAGLVNSISDGYMTAYIPYMVVRPDLQGRGVGRELMQRLMARYQDMPRVALIAYGRAVGFYQAQGFSQVQGTRAMFVSSLAV